MHNPLNRRDQVTRILKPPVRIIDNPALLVLLNPIPINVPLQRRSTVDDVSVCFLQSMLRPQIAAFFIENMHPVDLA